MELHLPFPPSPENASKIAGACVDMVHKIRGDELDYSVESLGLVEEILDGFHKSGDRSENIGSTAFMFGAYVGEIMVRHAGAHWVDTTVDPEVPPDMGFPMSIRHGDNLAIPFFKVCKRIDNGEEDNIPYYYTVLTNIWTDGMHSQPPPKATKRSWVRRWFGRGNA